jgi:radical SAM superfamily enzyme YgiQ (UPF0313 family)
MKHRKFLLINPPIYDFAAYDLWTTPLGLLYIAGILESNGHNVKLFDFLDRHHPSLPKPKSNKWGCGQYISQEIPKPAVLKNIPRIYSRYGLPESIFRSDISKIDKPDAILITSVMTYWYPGVIEAVKLVKSVFPGTPVVLGGVYATLCPEHALKFSGADKIFCGWNINNLSKVLKGLGMDIDIEIPAFNDFSAPYFDYYSKLAYASLRTSCGCPFKCSYCAIDKLAGPGFNRKNPDKILKEIGAFVRQEIINFAFYDDALLFEADKHIIPILEGIIKNGFQINLHTPNGLHTRFITAKLAKLMKTAGFLMPRVSLETANPDKQKETGGKVYNDEFTRVCAYLKEAGYKKGGFGTYILMGMPGQSFGEIEDSIRFAHNNGAKVFLAEYSPIPQTKDWEKVKGSIVSSDPLWHNNSIFPLYPLADWPKFQKLKDTAKELNRKFEI